MQRDELLLGEMIDAAEQIQELVKGVALEQLASDRQRRDALLWNYTVLGEAAAKGVGRAEEHVFGSSLAATVSTAKSHRSRLLVD